MAKLSTESLDLIEQLKSDKLTSKSIALLLETFVEAQEKDILRLTISADNEKDLILKKAKSEGARKILLDFISYFGLNK